MRWPIAAVPLLWALIVVAGACGAPDRVTTASTTPSATATPSPSSAPTAAPTPIPTATPTSTPTVKPTPLPTATKTPFVWQLIANGGDSFVNVTGAPVGSVCSAKALLTSGANIASQAVQPISVTKPNQDVSWDANKLGRLLKLPSPAPSPGQQAQWHITCLNNALNPPSGSAPPSSPFPTPTP